jgi:glycosyltransferase involved in cell wall biosynthesis
LLLSHLKPDKGIAEALAASDRLPEGASLTIHGPSIPGVTVPRNHPRALFAGPLRRADVADVIAAHDALVFPSWYEGEGMPGSVIEAMQSGLPVIAARWRSLPELVQHERNGLLVAPRDVDDLADAMSRLTRDSELYLSLAHEARRTGERFRAAAWHEQLESCLEVLAGFETSIPGDSQIAA